MDDFIGGFFLGLLITSPVLTILSAREFIFQRNILKMKKLEKQLDAITHSKENENIIKEAEGLLKNGSRS
jgi:hypothetical protein